MEKGKNVAVIGLWHLGTVTAACFASHGHKVTGIDPNQETITNLSKKGIPPVYEPGLAELIKEQKKTGKLLFTTDFKSGLKKSEYVVIAFDTPVNEDDTPDLSPILESVNKAIPHLEKVCQSDAVSEAEEEEATRLLNQVKRRMPRLQHKKPKSSKKITIQ